MPDSPTKNPAKDPAKNNSEDDVVEVLDEKRVVPTPKIAASSWPQTLQDLKNNNQQPPLIYPRPTSDLIPRPPFLNPFTAFSARFANPAIPGPVPGGLGFPSWGLSVGVPPAWPTGYPIGRGHELMRRLCTMNPSFAQSIIEDYIRPQVNDIERRNSKAQIEKILKLNLFTKVVIRFAIFIIFWNYVPTTNPLFFSLDWISFHFWNWW